MTSSRLLTLLSLLQTRRDWPGSELADRLEVSRRTIRRDVERLRGLGYPVESLTGPAGGYRLAAGTAMAIASSSASARRPGRRSPASRRRACVRW
jgi:predicted DNA-binding transcriptional regulator YafY